MPDFSDLLEGLEIEIPEHVASLQLPDPVLTNYWRLADNRIFYITDEIKENVLEIQKAIIAINIADLGLEADKRRPIILIINSPGGYVIETFSLVDTMLASKTPIITVNGGIAYSGGFYLLVAGHKRYAFSHSKTMVHSGSGGQGGTFEQIEEQQKLYRKQVTEMNTFTLARTKIDDKTFKKNKTKDWYMDSAEQIEYGVVDHIIESLDDLFI